VVRYFRGTLLAVPDLLAHVGPNCSDGGTMAQRSSTSRVGSRGPGGPKAKGPCNLVGHKRAAAAWWPFANHVQSSDLELAKFHKPAQVAAIEPRSSATGEQGTSPRPRVLYR
jgi:hypothetical protein